MMPGEALVPAVDPSCAPITWHLNWAFAPSGWPVEVWQSPLGLH